MPYSCINCGMKQEGDFENGFDPKLCLNCGDALEQGKLAPSRFSPCGEKGFRGATNCTIGTTMTAIRNRGVENPD